MKLHERQAKQVFATAGIPVPNGILATTAEEAREAARTIGGRVAVKAQVPIGGRGKAGGIKLASTPDEAHAAAQAILGMDIKGFRVGSVLVEQAVRPSRELYLSVTVDRDRQSNVVIFSTSGGMDIEEVAATQPDAIAKVWIDPALGLRPFHLRRLVAQGRVEPELAKPLSGLVQTLYRLLKQHDAQLVEINPLAQTEDGQLVALDGKFEVDDNALFRHPDLVGPESGGEEHPLEREAKKQGLAYVKLSGEVGVIGNGAGLVMTTLDMVKRQGGSPANFLDIGGGAKAEVVARALRLVLSDPDVKSVLINVFGGITRGDEVAKGLLEAVGQVEGRKVPMVVRLAGTRAEEGRAILKDSPLIPAATFQEAARKAVELARGIGA